MEGRKEVGERVAVWEWAILEGRMGPECKQTQVGTLKGFEVGMGTMQEETVRRERRKLGYTKGQEMKE